VLAAQQRLLGSAGITPTYVVGPNAQVWPHLLEVGRSGHVGRFLYFDSPGDYPELYREPYRWDEAHLASMGARRFTELLAERLAGDLVNSPSGLEVGKGAASEGMSVR
jgi:hypothetical protein